MIALEVSIVRIGNLQLFGIIVFLLFLMCSRDLMFIGILSLYDFANEGCVETKKILHKLYVLMMINHYEAKPKLLNLTTNGCFKCSY